jgi:hypothetical protein
MDTVQKAAIAVQPVFSKTVQLALHAHHIVHYVLLKNIAISVLMDSYLSMEVDTLIVSKFVVMEKDSNQTAMMAIVEMVMVAIATVRFKKDGAVQEVQLFVQALVFNLFHLDL